MARKDIKAVSVYANDAAHRILDDAAARENRSKSNFLLDLGLKRAEELGLLVPPSAPKPRKKKAVKS